MGRIQFERVNLFGVLINYLVDWLHIMDAALGGRHEPIVWPAGDGRRRIGGRSPVKLGLNCLKRNGLTRLFNYQ